MRNLVALFLAVVIAFSGVSAEPFLGGPELAHAAQSTPYAFTYTYYSDLAFKDGGSATLAVGAKKKLGLINRSGAIRWASSNTKVATVTQTGIVSAKRAGITRVSARNLETNRSVVCTVKVYKKRTQAQARKAILALKKSYYPGRHWTNMMPR